IGMSAVAFATACALGVELAKIKSTLEFTRFVAIVVFILESFCAFCTSYSTSSPASDNAFLKPSNAAFKESCSTICVTPILYFSFASPFLFPSSSDLESPCPHADSNNAAPKRTAAPFFHFNFIQFPPHSSTLLCNKATNILSLWYTDKRQLSISLKYTKNLDTCSSRFFFYTVCRSSSFLKKLFIA